MTNIPLQELSSAELIQEHRALNKNSGAKAHHATSEEKKRKLQLRDEITRRALGDVPECVDYLGERDAQARAAQTQLNAGSAGGRQIPPDRRKELEEEVRQSGDVVELNSHRGTGFEALVEPVARVVDKVAAVRSTG